MARNRHKGNKAGEAFVMLPYSVLNAPKFLTLSPHAYKLLLDVAAQYRGDNNGDLTVAWKVMQPRGWRSEATLHKVKAELLQAGLFYETRKGRRPNVCSLFALTWFNLDDSPKFDPGAKAGFVRGAYRPTGPSVTIICSSKNGRNATSPAVAVSPA